MTMSAQVDAGGRSPRLFGRHDAGRRIELLAAVLIVVGAVGWRRGEYFSGSLDPVVVGKAVVSLLALSLAFLRAQSVPGRRLGTGTLWWLGLLLGISVFGALTADLLVAGGVVAIRVAVLAATVVFLLRAAPAVQVITDLARACGAVAVVAAGTGLPTITSGRLAGGVPAIDPNELALLSGVVVLVLAWRAVLGEARWSAGVTGAVLLAVVWVTGSRTGLLMLLLGIAVMAVQIRRPRVGLVVGCLVLGAVGAVGAVATGAVAAFAGRDGTGASTLDSRFIAWRASLSWADSAWQEVFGGGLSVKIIRVYGQYWQTQPLDSSWVSLLVQTGVLGVLCALGWSLWAFRGALRAPHPHRVLFLGLLVFLLGRSTLESGLFDATPAFLLFLAVSLLAEGGSRQRLRDEAASGAGGIPEPALDDARTPSGRR
ncbi:O-antigen ligase family protein [Modestobacter lapidis]|nr:O-antigen ligase family protein [Modestobacter lapidis]